MKQYFSFLCILLITNFCNACVCSETGTMEKTVKDTDVIVSGKIISKEPFSKKDIETTGLRMPYIKYTLIVSAKIKGAIRTKTITIVTAPDGAGSCGYRFEIGSTYIIYADIREDNKKDKFMYTSICSRTKKFDQIEFSKIKRYCKLKGYS